MKKYFFLPIALLSVLLLATGCPDWEHDPQPYLYVTGTYVLNGGTPGGADATLVPYVYQSKETPADLFGSANGGKTLGATAEDMLCVNGCFYLCATADQILYKTDSLGLILEEIVTPGTARSPRHIINYKDKLYVSYAEGFVAEIDTATSAIRVLEVGGTPNGLCASNDKVYVALSGNTSTSVAVIEARSFASLSALTVATNPRKLAALSDQVVYLLSDGNGAGEKAVLQVIDTKKDEVYPLNSIRNAVDFTYSGRIVYVLQKMDAERYHICPVDGDLGLAIQENILSGDEQLTLPTSFSADPVNGFLFIGQKSATGEGSLKVFSSNGNYLDTFNSGNSAPAGTYFSTAIRYL